jgi:predicted aspartyl protease
LGADVRKRFAIAAIAFILFPGVASAADPAPCSLKRIASIDMLAPTFGVPAVPVEIDGTKLQFFIDTGGVLSSLSADAIKKLNLTSKLGDASQAEYQGNGRRVTSVVDVSSLQIGEMRGSDMQFTVDPDVFADNMDGRISPDILRGFDVDFDFAANKLNFFSQDHCEGKVVYWATAYTAIPMTLDRTGHIVMRVVLDGETLDALVDTGSTFSTISETIADRAFHVSPGSPGVEHNPNAKPDDIIQYRYRFKSLSMNGVAVNNPMFYILPDLAEAQMRNELGKLANDPQYGISSPLPRLVIGMDVLRQLHLYIAYKENMLYATAASAH